MQLVINACFGGFDLSRLEIDLYIKYLKEKDPTLEIGSDFFKNKDISTLIPRYDPCLIRVVRESKEKDSKWQAEHSGSG